MIRNQLKNDVRRRWILVAFAGLALAIVPAIKAHASFPFSSTWSEAYGGNWTAFTSLTVTADEITHSAEITSSIDAIYPPVEFEDTTAVFQSSDPIHIECADDDDIVTEETGHNVKIGATWYHQFSGDALPCSDVNG